MSDEARPISRILTRAVMFLAVAQGICQAQTGSTIMGKVLDPTGRPVANFWVELMDEVDAILSRTRTNGAGLYSFSRLSNGVFQVRVVTGGTEYAPQTYRVSLTPGWNTSGTATVIEQRDFNLRFENPPQTASASGGVVFAQQVPDAARQAYDAGKALLDAGKDPDAGMAKLREAVDAFPNYYAALERLGVEHVKLGQYEPAIAVLIRALEVNPNGQDSFYAMGVAQFRQRKYAESTDSLRKMLALAPTSSNAAYAEYFLGLSMMRGAKEADAESHLRRACQMGGDTVPADVHMALAQIASNGKRYREAADELELFLKAAPDARDADKLRVLVKQLRAKQK